MCGADIWAYLVCFCLLLPQTGEQFAWGTNLESQCVQNYKNKCVYTSVCVRCLRLRVSLLQVFMSVMKCSWTEDWSKHAEIHRKVIVSYACVYITPITRECALPRQPCILVEFSPVHSRDISMFPPRGEDACELWSRTARVTYPLPYSFVQSLTNSSI